MLLSIVIPHYNIPEELLRRCIDSILSQDVPPEEFEVVVVDDGSVLPPVWLGETYSGRNVRLLQGEHGGPGAARNMGIEEALGKYIQFVDADDFLLQNGQFSQCLSMLKAECPQILRFHYHATLNAAQVKCKNKNVKFGNTISGAVYMKENNLFGSPCTYFFQKELAIENNVRFPENMFHEDEVFNTVLHYHAQTLVDSNAVLYCYCIREGSTIANSSPSFAMRRLDDMFTAIGMLAAFKEKYSATANSLQSAGISRKLDILAVDAVVNMMHAGWKAKDVYSACLSRLSPLGIYPLNAANYSFKYKLFRFLANRKWGMRLLRVVIPKHKPVRR